MVGFVVGIELLAGSAALVLFGERLERRRPRDAWLVSLGRLLLGVAGFALVATASIVVGLVLGLGVLGLAFAFGVAKQRRPIEISGPAARALGEARDDRPAKRNVAATLVVCVAIALPIVSYVGRVDVTCGIVVGIDQTSLTDVHGFTLRLPDATSAAYRIEVARLASDSFVPGHLREHLALSAPVCVTHAPGDVLALDLRDQLVATPLPATSATGSP